MRKRTLFILVGALLLLTAWALFRPEYLLLDVRVDEPLPGGAATAADGPPPTLATGSFHGVAHTTSGVASIYEIDGRRVLRLSDLATSFGPDVRVVLVEAPDLSATALKGVRYLEVGPLKGNVGAQNYDLPAGFDPARHRAVAIWCRRFDVNFATAPLRPLAG